MGWRINPLSEDGVDAYTHTWTVAFFLFISFLVLVIPTNFNPSTSETSALPRFDAFCWCPAQFEESQVTYTNGICGAAFNAWIEGSKYEYAHTYTHDLHDLTPPDFKLDKNASMMDNGHSEIIVDKENQKRPSIPVAGILFLLAVCLRIPHLFWSILSSCTSCINIDQTLQAAKAGDSMDAENRQQLYSRLIKAFSDSFRGRPKCSTYLYIFMKCMVILVIIAEIIFVTKHSLIRTQYASNYTVEERRSWFDHSFSVKQKSEPYENFVKHCYFPIKQMSNVHDYNVQCLFKRQQIAPKLMNEPTLSERVLETTDSMLCNVHIMVVSVLIVLAAANVINTSCLLFNLCRTSNRMRMGLRRTSPLDLVLLIYLARANLGVSVATSLAELAAVNPESGKGEQLT